MAKKDNGNKDNKDNGDKDNKAFKAGKTKGSDGDTADYYNPHIDNDKPGGTTEQSHRHEKN